MKSLKANLWIIFLFLFSSIYCQKEVVDHSSWDQILILNVTDDGLVDYDGVTSIAVVFYTYFRSLQTISPKENWSREEKLAYWLNVYNATAMKMIIDEYPIKTINDIENPWKRKVFKSQNVRYSLDDIEHDILRKFGDPRIHFLLNCGSMSSPRLWNRAYTSANINESLEERTREFINDPQRNQINSSVVRISELFKWYEKDFTSQNVDVIDFINRYANVKISKNLRLTDRNYITYDWSLNKNNNKTPITSNN
ncbi:DUF547 domain-containing protein [Aquimarina spongiae]|uniref:DUF547 domain-containing protein n=1 Tax=Aquimarina spongiae TaxID=570521 RepID=A0A1M6ELM8_9FLAO|nr:DUF547 domain-containing protein [Aquimarina spongiae]SHI86299.1 Protein of unknown function, DUF547 [Aquimarina spongiae]